MNDSMTVARIETAQDNACKTGVTTSTYTLQHVTSFLVHLYLACPHL